MIDSPAVRQNRDEPAVRQAECARTTDLRIALTAARAANDASAVGQHDHRAAIRAAINGAPVRSPVNTPAVRIDGYASAVARSVSALRRCRHRRPQQERAHQYHNLDLSLHFPVLHLYLWGETASVRG